MKPSVNQIHIENLKLLEDCFKDNTLAPLLQGILSGVKHRLSYYDTLLAGLDGGVSIDEYMEASSNLAEDLQKVTANYNALLKRHGDLLEQNQKLQERLEEMLLKQSS